MRRNNFMNTFLSHWNEVLIRTHLFKSQWVWLLKGVDILLTRWLLGLCSSQLVFWDFCTEIDSCWWAVSEVKVTSKVGLIYFWQIMKNDVNENSFHTCRSVLCNQWAVSSSFSLSLSLSHTETHTLKHTHWNTHTHSLSLRCLEAKHWIFHPV